MPPRTQREDSVTVRTRRFMSNRLLNRKQFIVDIVHPGNTGVSKEEIRKKLSKMYKVTNPQLVQLYGFRTEFGGGRSSGFGLIYDDLDSMKKFEQKSRLIKMGLDTKRPDSRKQRKEAKGREIKVRGKFKHVGKPKRQKKGE